jgi:hypothetical protein
MPYVHRFVRFTVLGLAGLAACSQADSGSPSDAGTDAPPIITQPWLSGAKILVDGHAADDLTLDCRTVICRHNENTDLTTYGGAIYLVHRTAISQTLGPNSALHIYKTTDAGATFTETARIPAPSDRDLRDPAFFQIGGELWMKALTRKAVLSARDSNVDTVTVAMHTHDGVNWTPMQPIAPNGWSFWRVKEHGGTYYSAAYQDGDQSVVLYTSTDGTTWTAGPTVWGTAADTPLETELQFFPSGKMLALVRMDGSDMELLGDQGRLRTKVCWSSPPYSTFDCSNEIDGQRLDGPISFLWQNRLFVVARKHLQGTGKKRTSLFELTGDFVNGGALAIKEWGEIPSAGDTSYAGVAFPDSTHALVTWYSGDLVRDRPWALAMFDLTDIWQGTIDLGMLQ